MKFEKFQPGMTVYDVRRHKMGNTTLSTVGVWHVKILEVDAQSRRVFASWNNNRPEWVNERTATKWRPSKPMLIKGFFGAERLASRAEIAAAKANSA